MTRPSDGRITAMAPFVQPRASLEDLQAAEASLAQLGDAARSADARDWHLEPATAFDPTAAFAELSPADWPPDLADRAEPEAVGVDAPPGSGLAADLAAVAQGRATPDEVAAAYRARLARLQPSLNAFLAVCPPDHPQARPATGRGTGGARPALLGAAMAVKDIIETAGLPTTGGSRQRLQHVPSADATCWARLRAEGATLLGKTNTHEFAAGTTNENEAFGPARNPFDPGRVPGGSSGGSAAAVAAGMAAAALGTDTGGSVRIPAACCGVVGLKPTYGRISRRGVFSLAWSLDHVGPIARSVRDAGLLFAAMAGADRADPTTRRAPPLPTGAAAALGFPLRHLRGLRVAVPAAWLDEAGPSARATGGIPLSRGVRAAFERAVRWLSELGAEVGACDLGSADAATAVNRAIALPESAAWHAPYLDASPEHYGRQVRARLLAGRFVLAEEYLQAQRLRTLVCRRHAAAVGGPRGAHVLVTPTLPTVAPAIGAPAAEGLALLRFCSPFNLTGWPAVTLPCGAGEHGLPVGVQLVAPPYREPELLAVAATLERALGESARPRPPLSG